MVYNGGCWNSAAVYREHTGVSNYMESSACSTVTSGPSLHEKHLALMVTSGVGLPSRLVYFKLLNCNLHLRILPPLLRVYEAVYSFIVPV